MKNQTMKGQRRTMSKKRDDIVRANALNYNASLQLWYNRGIQKLIKKMTTEVKKEVTKLFKRLPVPEFTSDESIGSQSRILMNMLTDKFEKLFAREGQDLVDHMMERNLEISSVNIKKSLKELSGGLSINTSRVPKELTDVVNASIAENVSLIKSIPAQYFKDVTGAVMRSITSGQGLYDLLPEIKKYEGVTARRAELIALDQTRKAYSSVNAIKLDKLGVKKFEWLHSGGSREPRESHIKIDGEIFSFANLEAEQAARGVPKQDRGLPGTPINCRCRIVAVIDFDGDDE